MIRAWWWGGWILLAASVSACANLNSVKRSTELSQPKEGGQKAVHLDVKQRVVIAKDVPVEGTDKDGTDKVRFMAACAEPSPDALSAYAQSIGLSLSIPTQGAVGGSQAAAETAASIGLRTQSITLMRDSLYRVCEAYYNQALNGQQVMQLLDHAQDVTVGILAIEQLTGVTAAQQAVLGGNANAVATSQVAYMQALLDGATENATKLDDSLKAAKTEEDAARRARDDAQTALNAETDATKRVPLQEALSQKERDLTAAQAKTATARIRADDAKTVKDTIQKNPTQALANASAAASGSGQFGNAISTVKLDAASTEKIAAAVQGIVKSIVDKDYTSNACLAFITRNWPAHTLKDSVAQQQYIESLKVCRAIVLRKQQITQLP